MPRDIAVADRTPITLAALAEWLSGPEFDPADEDGLAAAGPMLARLGADRGFLGDRAVATLKRRCVDERAGGNRYGPQVMLLHPGRGDWFIRANIWPAADDPVVRTSGVAPFFYGVAHDHNFSFLTTGYFGPGYWSDYWERDPHQTGSAGDAVALTLVGRSRLDEGRTMLYRAHRDVHRQHPADALSVSINIMHVPAGLSWRDQYRFDPEGGTIAGVLTASAAETLVALSLHLGGGDGIDFVHDMARRHPSARLRATAWDALADAESDMAAASALLEIGADDADRRVAGRSRARLAEIAR